MPCECVNGTRLRIQSNIMLDYLKSMEFLQSWKIQNTEHHLHPGSATADIMQQVLENLPPSCQTQNKTELV